MILALCAAWLQLQKLVKQSVMCTDDLVSVYSLCGLVEGCSAQLRCISPIQSCHVGMLPFLQFVTSQHGHRLLASLNFHGIKLLWMAADLQKLCKVKAMKK